MDVGRRNLHIMSLAFLLILTSFMTAQNFATTLDPTLGPISLAVVYLFWIIALLTISTSAVNFLTPKYAMFFGSIAYPIYVASGIELGHHIFKTLYLLGSMLIGIGGGLLWVGQSVFIVKCCNFHENKTNLPINSKLGTFNGIFNLHVQFARFIGFLIAALIFQFNGSTLMMFIVMITTGICGSFLLLPLKSLNIHKNEHKESVDVPKKPDTRKSRVRSKSIASMRSETRTPEASPSPPPRSPLVSSPPEASPSPPPMSPVSPPEISTAHHPSFAVDVKIDTIPIQPSTNSNQAPISPSIDGEEKKTATAARNKLKLINLSTNSNHPEQMNDHTERPKSKPVVMKVIIEDKSDFARIKQEMINIISLFKNKTFIWLIPITITFGLFTTFISGDVATLIQDPAFKFYVLTVEGFVAGISSLVMGKCADKWGPIYFIFICCICFNCVYVFFYFWEIDQDATLIWMIIAALLGIGDGGILTLIPQIYPILLGDAGSVFASMRMVQSLALGIGFAYYPITSFNIRILVNVIMATSGCICILIPKHIRNALIVSANTKNVQE